MAKAETYEGGPCAKGHTLRYVKGRGCVECRRDKGRGKRMFATPEYSAALRASHRRWKENNLKEYRLRGSKVNARRGGWDHTLSVDDVFWPTHCPILGIALDYSVGSRNKGGPATMAAPSFDRKDPTKAYIKGNVQIVSMRANTIKSNATPEQVARVAEWMRVFS